MFVDTDIPIRVRHAEHGSGVTRTDVIARVVALAFVMAFPATVAAQPTDAVLDIAVGVGWVPPVSNACEENGYVVADCGPTVNAWSGSLAWRLTDRTAIVGEMRGAYASQVTTATKDDGALPLEWDSRAYTLKAGIRRYLRRTGSRIAPFAEVLSGYGRGRLRFTRRPSGFDDGPADLQAFVLAPGAGIDIFFAPRVAVRVKGRWGVGFSEGEVSRSFEGRTGIVFALGNR